MSISPETQTELLEAYEKSRGLYGDLSSTVATLIGTLLQQRNVQVHAVSHRAKSRDSLAQKITRPDKSYRALIEITDLAGIRITTYFADDVDRAPRQSVKSL